MALFTRVCSPHPAVVFALLAFSLSAGCNAIALQDTPEVNAPMHSRPGHIAASRGPARPVPSHPVCFNVNALLVDNWSDSDLLKSVGELKIDVLRIPGGTVANYWDWKRGGITTNPAAQSEMPGQLRQTSARQFDSGKPGDFLALFESTGADAILVLNMLSSNLDDQIDFIRQSMKQGLPVKYVELGNEFYESKPAYLGSFPTAEAYALEAIRWSKAIKKEFPDLKIGLVGVNPRIGQAKGGQRLQDWNSLIVKLSLPQADALTLHEYQNTQGLRSSAQPDIFNRLYANLFTASRGLLDDTTRSRFPATKSIWITEYNLLAGNEVPWLAGSWAHGLYVATLAALFLEEPKIDIACNHALVGNARFGAIFADESVTGSNVFAGAANPQRLSVQPYTLSASGMSVALFSRAIHGKQRANQLSFSVAGAGKERKGIYGWYFENERGEKDTFVVNLTNKAMTLEVPDLFSGDRAQLEQLSAKPDLLITSESRLTSSRTSVESNVNLPAYSVTRIFVR